MSKGLNMAKLRHYRPSWDWEGLRGSHLCLHWNVRDLETLDVVIAKTPGRRVAVQAGGNLGLFPKRLAESFELVYTFEPDQKLFDYIQHNAPEENIVPVRAALGNSREPVAMGYGRRDGSRRDVHEGLTHIAGPGTIPQMRIDDLGLHACDLIYLDIEGYELTALRGAEETVARHRPVIAVEVNGNVAFYGVTKQELSDWFAERRYTKVARIHGDDIYIPAEHVL